MDKYSELFRIKAEIRNVEQKLISPRAEEMEEAKQELRKLAQHFQNEYGQFMSPAQVEWAGNDADYFSFLLEEAIVYYKKMIMEGKPF